MKFKVLPLTILVLLLFFQKGHPQTLTDQEEIQPLQIGDFLPDILLENILFDDSSITKTADFRGSYLILDFWATWCAPCVASFPKTAELNETYEGKLKILPVTYQSKEEVEKLFERSSKLKGLKIPMVYGDNLLRYLFPHQTLPHYVWVDPSGKIIASTYGDDITEENIDKVIGGRTSTLGSKNDKIIEFDFHKPLLAGNTNFGETPIYYQSALTGHIEGLPNAIEIIYDEQRKVRKFLFTNTSIKYLFAMGFSEGKGMFLPKTIEIDVQDPDKISSNKKGEAYKNWKLQGNSYCYELIVPEMSEDQKWSLLKSELTKLFPQYEVSVEEKEMPTLTLKAISNPSSLKSKGGAPKHQFTGFSGQLQNTRIDMLVGHLNTMYLQNDQRVVVNKTGIDFPIDLYFEANLSNVDEINKGLSGYGLILVEEIHSIKKMIIKDNSNHKER